MNNLVKECNKENITIEILKNSEKCTNIEVFNDEISKFEVSNANNYKIKAKIKDKIVALIVDNIKNNKDIINSIKENYELLDNVNESSFAKINKDFKSKKRDNTDICVIKNDLLSLNSLKREFDKITNISSNITKVDNKIEITNNLVKLNDSNSYYTYSVELVLNNNGEVLTSRNYMYFNKYNYNDVKKFVLNEINVLYGKCKSKNCITDKYDIILSNKCVLSLLSYFSSMFAEESISKKISILKDKFNKKVFSDNITIVEDPTSNKFVTTRYFDNEGTLTYKKTLVDKGVFVTKLYNNEYAKKCNTKSTGNSFGTYNLCVLEGKENMSALISKLNNGIIISNIEGLHAGINTITGSISLMCDGYQVKNGKKELFIKDMIMTTNMLELFGNVKSVCNDSLYDKGTFASPSLLIENISISGSEK